MKRTLIHCLILLATAAAQASEGDRTSMELPAEIREWFRNHNGSCVQCSVSMTGVWNNNPAATTLLWDTTYGSAVRGASGPKRVSDYCQRRGIPAWNVTGSATYDWMEWAAKTGRFAAIGAGTRHFQTEYGRDRDEGRWFVCNNNSPQKIDEYSNDGFRRLHEASGEWIVVLKGHAPPLPPAYLRW